MVVRTKPNEVKIDKFKDSMIGKIQIFKNEDTT